MNEERIAVLMDTGGDLPADLCAREGIEILPLHVIYPEKDYLDGLNINPMMVYDRFPDEIPSTSTPSIQEVLDKFREIADKGYNKLIVITISSALSSTGHTVSIAARDYPDLEIHVFDTRNISFGSGIFALWAARRIREGVSFRDLVDQLYAKRGASRQFFYMDTLKYLRHGGRIGLRGRLAGARRAAHRHRAPAHLVVFAEITLRADVRALGPGVDEDAVRMALPGAGQDDADGRRGDCPPASWMSSQFVSHGCPPHCGVWFMFLGNKH